jgi:hypothetical protein
LNVTDQPSLAKVFAAKFAQQLSSNVLEAPFDVSKLFEELRLMCSEAELVKVATMRLFGDDRCDRTDFCLKYIDLLLFSNVCN